MVPIRIPVGHAFPRRASLMLISETGKSTEVHAGRSVLTEQGWDTGSAHGEVRKIQLSHSKLIFNDCSEKHA